MSYLVAKNLLSAPFVEIMEIAKDIPGPPIPLHPPLASNAQRIAFPRDYSQAAIVTEFRREFMEGIGNPAEQVPTDGLRLIAPNDGYIFFGGTPSIEPVFYQRRGPAFMRWNIALPAGTYVPVAAFSESSRYLAVVASDDTSKVRILRREGNGFELIHVIDAGFAVTSLLITASDTYLAIRGATGYVLHEFLDAQSGPFPEVSGIPAGRLLAVSPNVHYFAVAPLNVAVAVEMYEFDNGSFTKLLDLDSSTGDDRRGSFSPDGNVFELSSSNSGIRFYSVSDGNFKYVNSESNNVDGALLEHVRYSRSSEYALIGGGLYKQAEAPIGKYFPSDDTIEGNIQLRRTSRDGNRVSYQLSTGGQFLVVAEHGVNGWEPIATIAATQVGDHCLSGDGNVVAAKLNTGNGFEIQIYEYDGVEFVHRFTIPDAVYFGDVLLSHDGSTLITTVTRSAPSNPSQVRYYKWDGTEYQLKDASITASYAVQRTFHLIDIDPDGNYFAYYQRSIQGSTYSQNPFLQVYVRAIEAELFGAGLYQQNFTNLQHPTQSNQYLTIETGHLGSNGYFLYHRTEPVAPFGTINRVLRMAKLDGGGFVNVDLHDKGITTGSIGRYFGMSADGHRIVASGGSSPGFTYWDYDEVEDVYVQQNDIIFDFPGQLHKLSLDGRFAFYRQGTLQITVFEYLDPIPEQYREFSYEFMQGYGGTPTSNFGYDDLIFHVGSNHRRADDPGTPVDPLPFDDEFAANQISNVMWSRSGNFVLYDSPDGPSVSVRTHGEDGYTKAKNLNGLFISKYVREPDSFVETEYVAHDIEAQISNLVYSKTGQAFSYFLLDEPATTGRYIYDTAGSRLDLKGIDYDPRMEASFMAFSPWETYGAATFRMSDGANEIRLYSLGVNRAYVHEDTKPVAFGPLDISACDDVLVAHGGLTNPFTLFKQIDMELEPDEFPVVNWEYESLIWDIVFTEDCQTVYVGTEEELVVITDDEVVDESELEQPPEDGDTITIETSDPESEQSEDRIVQRNRNGGGGGGSGGGGGTWRAGPGRTIVNISYIRYSTVHVTVRR